MAGGGWVRRGCAFFLVCSALAVLAPAWLGGRASYAVVQGSSMEPEVGRGDLAVLRQRGSYRPGQVVGYKSRQLGRVVLHRIVGEEGGRFVLKGDSNHWLDSERPTADDVVGELWLRAPGVGRAMAWARRPVAAALLVGVGLMAVAGSEGRRRNKARGALMRTSLYVRTRRLGTSLKAVMDMPGRRLGSTFAQGSARPAPLVGAAVLTTGSLLLGLAAFTRPATVSSQGRAAYHQRGNFAYAAPVPAGPVYQKDHLSTGDPVFLRLVSRVPVAFSYELRSEAPHAASGSGRLVAEVGDPGSGGWRRTLDLGGPVPFAGDRLSLAGELDLAGLRSMIKAAEAATGVSRDQYVVTVRAEVEVAGEMAAQPFREAFSSTMAFRLDSLVLRPEAGELSTDPGTGAPVRTTTAQGSVQVPGRQASSVSLFGLALPTPLTRGVAVVGAVLGLLVLAAAARMARGSGAPDEVAAIEAAYGTHLVPVATLPEGFAQAARVPSIDVLARLADREEGLILHAASGDVHRYLVDRGGRLFLYEARADSDEPGEEHYDLDAGSLEGGAPAALVPASNGGNRPGP